jgi:hypothetical protein
MCEILRNKFPLAKCNQNLTLCIDQFKVTRWVAKLVAPACYGSSLGSEKNPDISQNTKMGDISVRSDGLTLEPAKKIYKKSLPKWRAV